jgi:FMN-dependent NADH-azoreductase
MKSKCINFKLQSLIVSYLKTNLMTLPTWQVASWTTLSYNKIEDAVILKGFIDKVIKMDFAYVVTKTGVKGRLTHINETVVITTSTSPTWYLRWYIGNPIGKIFVNRTLKQLGFQNRKWINFGGITNAKQSQREKFLQEVIHKI